MATYRPVGVDEGWNLPPEAREALAASDELTAKYAEKLPAVGSLSYDSNGNVTTDQDGTVYTYNSDGTVHTITRDAVTRTLTYNSGGTIASVA